MASTTKVVVLDDDLAVRELLETMLLDEGYAVPSLSLAPIPELVEQLAAARPSLVIVDWRLGGGLQGEAFQAIRADRRLASTPVVICTGDLDGMRDHAPRLATHSGVAIVEKPFQIDVLLSVVERLSAASRPSGTGKASPTLTDQLREAVARRTRTGQARGVLNAFRGTGGWAAAELWVADRGLLRCVAAVADRERRPFVEHSRAISLVPGFGLPGRVAISARPAWIEDVEQDRNFPRIRAARQSHIHAAAAAPVPLGSTVLGAFAVYAAEHRTGDAAVLDTLAGMARSLGPWLEQARGQLLRPDPISAAARELAREVAPLADVAAVDLLGAGGELYRVAVTHRDPAMADVALRLEAFAPAPEGPVARAVESQQVQRMAISDATLRRWSGSPEHLLLLRAVEMRSLTSIPLLHARGVLGAVTLSSADPRWHESRAALEAEAALSTPAAASRLARALRSQKGSPFSSARN